MICDFSDLPTETCAHCQGIPEEKEVHPVFGNDDPVEFEILSVFPAQYAGTCTIDRDHTIKRGDRVARVQRADNPMLVVSGVACSQCTRILSYA